MKPITEILQFFDETEQQNGLGKIDKLVIYVSNSKTQMVYDNTMVGQHYPLRALLGAFITPDIEILDAFVERSHHPKAITFNLTVNSINR